MCTYIGLLYRRFKFSLSALSVSTYQDREKRRAQRPIYIAHIHMNIYIRATLTDGLAERAATEEEEYMPVFIIYIGDGRYAINLCRVRVTSYIYIGPRG